LNGFHILMREKVPMFNCVHLCDKELFGGLDFKDLSTFKELKEKI
jgi:hypothetical protein